MKDPLWIGPPVPVLFRIDDSAGCTRETPKYEFRRTESAPKPALDAVQSIYSDFLGRVAARWAGSGAVGMSPAPCTVEQLPFGCYLENRAKAGAVVLLGVSPYGGTALMHLSASLVGTAVDSLLGGRGPDEAESEAALTELELHVFRSLLEVMVGELCGAWAAFGGASFEIRSFHMRGGDGEAPAHDRLAVVLSAEMRRRGGGCITLVLESRAVRSMWDAARSNGSADTAEVDADSRRERMLALSKSAHVRAEACLLTSRIRVANLLHLKPGNVLTLPHPVGRPLDLEVNGKPKFRGQVVTTGRSLSFQIEETWRRSP